MLKLFPKPRCKTHMRTKRSTLSCSVLSLEKRYSPSVWPSTTALPPRDLQEHLATFWKVQVSTMTTEVTTMYRQPPRKQTPPMTETYPKRWKNTHQLLPRNNLFKVCLLSVWNLFLPFTELYCRPRIPTMSLPSVWPSKEQKTNLCPTWMHHLRLHLSALRFWKRVDIILVLLCMRRLRVFFCSSLSCIFTW